MVERTGSLFPLVKSSWDSAFRAIERSSNRENAVQFVSKAAVSGVPYEFHRVEGSTMVPTYRKSGRVTGLCIRDLGLVYAVSMNQRNRGGLVSSGTSGSPFWSNRASRSVPAKRSSTASTQSGGGSDLAAAGKAVGASILLYAGYKGLEALGSAAESRSTQQEPGLSRLAHAANCLDNKEYKIFVSHSWRYDDHYERVVDFLEEVPSLDWQNHSVPSTDPLPATTDDELRQELRRQIRPASVVIVSAGMYGAHSKWINIELDLAEKFGKPVIAIVPDGQQRVPKRIQESCSVQVGWRQASLIDALAEYG